jgi:hypothetical protein
MRIRGRGLSARGAREPRARFRAVKSVVKTIGREGGEGRGGDVYLAGYDGKFGCE